MVLEKPITGIRKMLSFNNIGNLGRLANQMFQYASLKGIARYRQYDFCIPPKEVFGRIDANVRQTDLNLYDVFDIEKSNEIFLTKNPIFAERTHSFDEEMFINCPDNVDLFGYYQSEKYFKHIEEEIRKDFLFKEELLDICSSFVEDNFDTEIISLHVRRGDYVTNANHPLQDEQYYIKSLNSLPDDLPVIVFSDDSNWCKEQKIFSPDRFVISENNSTDFDLCLMSLCQYHIIANSSYSWWGAWLANSKKVIAPNNWFGGDCVNKTIEDMKFKNLYFI
jgi:hypothetical protein